MTQNLETILDTSGLFCPEPVMLLHKSIRQLTVGAHIRVIATDPSTARDIPKFCHFLGHELIRRQEDQGKFIYIIKKC
jgi:tRNA 2-thiouridine synthesizing protein A